MYGIVRDMVKTTVYLPRELKRRLEALAKSSGESEAELIRRALDEFTGAHRPRPRVPLFASGEVAPIEDWEEAMRGFGDD
jgi:predicted transcriptional regulator